MSEADGLVVRKALLTDLLAAYAVFDAAFALLSPVYRPPGEVKAHENQRAQLGTRLVAVLDDSVVGTVQFEVHSEHVHLIGLAVRPDIQRRGVARRLVEHVAALAPALDRSVLALDTIRESGNVGVFERLGFRVTAEKPSGFFESDAFSQVHEVHMERSVL